MAESLLSEIHSDSLGWVVRVLVSRMWRFRGGTDTGPIRHVDLVVLDREGNHMYAQIPPAKAEELEDVLEEGKVYVFKKFLCNQSTPAFRAVDSPFMIQFTRFTVVDPMPGLEEGYPFCTYSLTPFLELPEPANTPARFIDVIGQITFVSDIIPVQAIHQAEPSNTRTVILRDLLGNDLRLVLWGERALEFDVAAVRSVGEKVPVIGIFVGTLPKNIQGTRGLSGSAACRWYIDEDIADINAFRTTLGEQFAPVASYAPSEREALAIRTREPPTEKTVQELRDLDPFDNKFFCTITVEALSSEQRWWFFSCEKCRRSSTPVGNVYNCADPACACIKADPSYSICTTAHDATARAEFMLFDKVAREVTGKPAMTLLRRRYPGYATFQQMAHVARADTTLPTEIKRMVGVKYKVVVSISTKSFNPNSHELSFQINRIVEAFKPDLPASPVGCPLELGGSSASQSPDHSLSGKTLFPPRTPSAPSVLHSPPSSKTLGLPQMSPPVEPPTTESALFTGSPTSAGTSKSVYPKCGTRVSLFAALPKEKDDEVETDPSDPTSTAMLPADPTLDDSGTATATLVVPSSTSKTRKGGTPAKQAGGAKKQKQ